MRQAELRISIGQRAHELSQHRNALVVMTWRFKSGGSTGMAESNDGHTQRGLK